MCLLDGGHEKEEGMTQPQAALPAETGHWWALAIRGGIAILFGLAALLRPGIALEALILLFGAYALVDGVFAIVGVFGGTRGGTPRWLLLSEGIAGILAGLIAFVLPGLTALLLLYLVAAWAIMIGGALSVLFGVILVVVSPFAGLLSLIWLIGIYAIAFGILMLVTAFSVRGGNSGGTSRSSRVV